MIENIMCEICENGNTSSQQSLTSHIKKSTAPKQNLNPGIMIFRMDWIRFWNYLPFRKSVLYDISLLSLDHQILNKNFITQLTKL